MKKEKDSKEIKSGITPVAALLLSRLKYQIPLMELIMEEKNSLVETPIKDLRRNNNFLLYMVMKNSELKRIFSDEQNDVLITMKEIVIDKLAPMLNQNEHSVLFVKAINASDQIKQNPQEPPF